MNLRTTAATALAAAAAVALAVPGVAQKAAARGADHHPAVMLRHARISASQAAKAALAKYPGKVVHKVTLENEEGKWQYSVMVRSGKILREVMVGANSGKVENVEVTTAAKEHIEEQADAAHAKAAHHHGATHKK